MNVDQPIGVFDSGLGGISVLREIVALLPAEDYIFYGDSANAPYGVRPTEEIRSLTKQASQKTYIGGLTKECVDAFVSMVYLYDDQTMKVEFNCEDVIRRALEKYGA